MATPSITNNLKSDSAPQIAEFVVETFEDKKGNLWFGTMGKGAARYDGKALTYISTKDGLCGNDVASITEDQKGNIWFGTHNGASKYDGTTFTNFGIKEGLHGLGCNVLVDRKGNVWAGTNDGLFSFTESSFSEFKIPNPPIKNPSYHWELSKVWTLIEDNQGNIWITSIPSSSPEEIKEGGICRYDGNTFTRFPEIIGLNEKSYYSICEDKTGIIWIGVANSGVYRYDGDKFTLFKKTDRMDLTWSLSVQSILEDRNETLWFGFSGGLFRLNGSDIINVTQEGPWN